MKISLELKAEKRAYAEKYDKIMYDARCIFETQNVNDPYAFHRAYKYAEKELKKIKGEKP